MSARHGARRRSGLSLALAATLIACAHVTPVEVRPPAREKACRPAPGPTPRECRLLGSDADWLPPAYVRNLTCHCQATPNSPTANCVRGHIEAAIAAVDAETQRTWQERKRTLHAAGRDEEYERWVREEAAPVIHAWHRDAQRACCCAAPLPPYERWVDAVIRPLDACSSAAAIDRFGSCRGGFDRW